jgi:membrane protein DedA with SNARE-associated domain
MAPADILADAVRQVADQPAALFVLIVIATFILEDIATVAVAVAASHMLIAPPLALTALIIGTAGGDVALYAAARWLRRWKPVARRTAFLETGAATGWLRRHAIWVVIGARFVPGTRLPVFAGAGAIGMNFGAFSLAVLGTTIVWTPALYLLAVEADMQAAGGPGVTGSIGLALAAGSLLLMPRLVRGSRAAARAFA